MAGCATEGVTDLLFRLFGGKDEIDDSLWWLEVLDILEPMVLVWSGVLRYVLVCRGS